MEVIMSRPDKIIFGLNSIKEGRIVNLVNEHMGSASVVHVRLLTEPLGVQLKANDRTIVVDSGLTKLVDT